MSTKPVEDSDPLRHYMTIALDPKQATEVFKQSMSIDRVHRATLIRHKPGRRCVIAYYVIDEAGESTSWVAKIRAKGLDRHSFELSTWLTNNGFDQSSPDGVSVPRPIAAIPCLNMTILQKVEGGSSVTQGVQPQSAMEQVARAIAKLNQAQPPINRTHTPQDELNTLKTGYGAIAPDRPELVKRLEVLLSRLEQRLALDESPTVLLHRDFYHDQVVSSPDRLWILDLDLAALGPAALDVGNFIGHLLELAIRNPQRAQALRESAKRLREAYREQVPGVKDSSIQLYVAATLARHVYLCQRFEDRRTFIEPILDAAESHL